MFCPLAAVWPSEKGLYLCALDQFNFQVTKQPYQHNQVVHKLSRRPSVCPNHIFRWGGTQAEPTKTMKSIKKKFKKMAGHSKKDVSQPVKAKPKVHRPKQPEGSKVCVGDQVVVMWKKEENRGTVKFIGPLEDEPEKYRYGIDLEYANGEHSGKPMGGERVYFECRPSHGILIEDHLVLSVERRLVVSSSFSPIPPACAPSPTYSYPRGSLFLPNVQYNSFHALRRRDIVALCVCVLPLSAMLGLVDVGGKKNVPNIPILCGCEVLPHSRVPVNT